MNVADIKLRVKRLFGDDAGVQITDDDICRWICDAQEEIIRQHRDLLQTASSANIVLNQQDYTLPSDLLVLNAITYNGHAVKELSLQEFYLYIDDWTNTTSHGNGTPTVYMVYGAAPGTLSLFPVPDTNITNGLKIFYCKKPTTVASDLDPLSVPSQYHKTIVDHCLQQAYELDEDWAASGNKAAQFQKNMNDLKNIRNIDNQNAAYPCIILLPEDMY